MKELLGQAHKELLELYHAFQDDLSRKIFLCRLNYLLSMDIRHLNKMSRLSEDLPQEDWVKIRSAEIVLYGTGRLSRETLDSVSADGLRVVLFCDSNSEKHGKRHLGLPVISPEDLVAVHRDKYVLIATSVFFDEIFIKLVQMGFPRKHIISLGDFNDIYFGENFLAPSNNEIYLDVGCNNGDTISNFLSFSNGNYKKIFGMEPDADNYSKTIDHVKETSIRDVQIFNLGAWSKKAELHFNSGEKADSSIAEDGNTRINAETIDRMVGSEDITFIKMDIEGAEKEALRGAESVIKRCRPKLAICVYHKPEDIVEIPAYILGLALDYKLYLRHHNHYPFWRDTVLYAV